MIIRISGMSFALLFIIKSFSSICAIANKHRNQDPLVNGIQLDTTTILNMKYMCEKGQLIAVNITRLAQLISKNKRVLQNFFNNTDYFQKVIFEPLNFEFSSNGKAGHSLGFKLISICNLLKQFNMNTDFYFFKHKEHSCYFKFNKSLVIDKKKQNKLEKKYSNNYNYLVKWKKSKVTETSNILYKNQLKKWFKIGDTVNKLFNIIQDQIDSFKNEQISRQFSKYRKVQNYSSLTDENKLVNSIDKIKYISEFIHFIVNRYIERWMEVSMQLRPPFRMHESIRKCTWAYERRHSEKKHVLLFNKKSY